MPLLSSALLVRTYALSLLTISYYLLTSPLDVLSSSPVWLLGESMNIRTAAFATEDPSAPTLGTKGPRGDESNCEVFALMALALGVYAVTQLLFAGDLTLLPAPSSGRGGGSSAQSSTQTSSRYAEETHTLLSAQSRWLTLSGLHVLASSVLVFWIYAFHSHTSSPTSAATPSLLSALGQLANRVTFTAGLADMLFWGYLWTVLKEEGREVAKGLALRRHGEDEDED